MKKLKIILFCLILSVNLIGGKSLHIHETNNVVRLDIEQVEEKNLDLYYSSKRLGSYIENGKTIFRLFAPTSENIKLIVFDTVEDSVGNEYLMSKDADRKSVV